MTRSGAIKIAEVPAGILTKEIAQKIMEAYHKKGSTLTLEEVEPFYKMEENATDKHKTPRP